MRAPGQTVWQALPRPSPKPTPKPSPILRNAVQTLRNRQRPTNPASPCPTLHKPPDLPHPDPLRAPPFPLCQAETDRQCFEREKVVMQNSKLAAQLETARGQLESLRIEKEAVQKQLTTAQDKHAQSEGQVAMLQEQVEVLQGQVSRREELKKGQLEDAAHELQRAKEEWVLERERLAQSVTAHVGDKVQLEETIAKLHADLRLTQLEQGKATKSAQRLERDIGEMEQVWLKAQRCAHLMSRLSCFGAVRGL